MSKKITVLVRDVNQQYEALRTSLGLLLDLAEVQMIVMENEIAVMNDAYSENMEFFDEMEGERYTTNRENAEKYGFTLIDHNQTAVMLKEAAVVVPF